MVPMTTARPDPEREAQDEGEPSARADAQRNRARVLAAAERILAQNTLGGLSMAEVARAAGVGVGTIYRRFGDQAGLIRAVMNRREAELQASLLEGDPPLGPGAEPAARIAAFLVAYADILEDFGELMATAEARMDHDRRFRTGPYRVHRDHLLGLIREVDTGLDAEFLADTLLAPLSAAIFVQQRRIDGMPLSRIKAGLTVLVDRLLG